MREQSGNPAGGPPEAAAPSEEWPAFTERWRRACRGDHRLTVLARDTNISFAVRGGEDHIAFSFGEPASDSTPDFVLVAAPGDWDTFFRPVPPPCFQNFFGMIMRVDGARVEGSELRFAQHAHLVRRVLELGRASAYPGEPASTTGPAAQPTEPAAADGPLPSAATEVPPPAPGAVGRYLTVELDGQPHRVYYEEAGQGRDVVLLHTAGADARQFHRLLADPRLTERCHLVAFDLPWHGKSFPPPGALPGDYSLTTDRYAQTVMAVVAGLGLRQPIVLGASMAGEICLELAYRHPDRLGGVVACEASETVPGRKVSWARHPEVNQSLFVPEWVDGLMAPTSPPVYRAEVWWAYSQGGYGTFYGDIDFYSGDWDATDRVTDIDTSRCPVVMLTGEYDYSCTPEMSRRTAARIPGAVFRPMPNLGHFPYAENPPLFVHHLLDALDTIDHSPEHAV